MRRWGKTAVLLLLSCLLLTGCMKAVRINQRAIVQGIGIDFEDGNYQLTLQIFDSKGTGGSTAIDPSKVNSMIVTAQGRTIDEAMNNASLKQGRRIFYGQNKMIVVGEDLARRGMDVVAAFFNANHESRPNVDVVTAPGKASEIITARISQSVLPILSVKNMLENSGSNGKILRGQVIHLVDALENGNLDVALPVLQKTKEGEDDGIAAAGTAVFQEEKLAGWLDEFATRGVLWVRGQVKNTHVVVEDRDLGQVSLEVVDADCRIIPSIRDGVPHFDIRCKVKSHAGESPVESRGRSLMEKSGDLEGLQSEVVRGEIEQALGRSLGELHCDIFGFCNQLRQKQSAWYQENAERYRELIPRITYDVQVESHITRFGMQA